MEQAVNAVATICLDDTAVFRFGMLFYHIAVVSEKRSGLDEFDSFVQTFSGSFNYSHGLWMRFRLVTHVVCFVQIAVKASVVECNIDIEDITIDENSFVWDTMADNFVRGRAYGFGEVAVVQR
jgi:hypothetical protein